MMDMLGQESAAATAASMGLRVSCVYQADTAPTANSANARTMANVRKDIQEQDDVSVKQDGLAGCVKPS